MKEIKRDAYLKELINRRNIPLVKVITGVFKRIVITGDMMLPGREENGIITMNVLDFLLNEDSLDKEMT